MNYEENLRVQIAAEIESIFDNVRDTNILAGFNDFYSRVLPKIDEYSSSYPIDFERYEPFYISKIKHSIKPILEKIWATPSANRHQIEEDFGNIGREIFVRYEKAGKTKTTGFLVKMATAYDQVNMQAGQENSAKDNKEGCYIATKVYGSSEHPQVLELRKFRDIKLKKSNIGKQLVRTYYHYSPKLAERLNNSSFNNLIRGILNLFIKFLYFFKIIK